MARALVRNPQVLFLDEATASIDTESDRIIQDTLRRKFRNKTVITIAHRLDTIMFSDRVLVLDDGHVAEFEDPLVLMDRDDSLFKAMCSAEGPAHATELRAMAEARGP